MIIFEFELTFHLLLIKSQQSSYCTFCSFQTHYVYYCGYRMPDTSCVLSLDRFLSHSLISDLIFDIGDIFWQWAIITLCVETTGNIHYLFFFVYHWSYVWQFQSFLTRYSTKRLILFWDQKTEGFIFLHFLSFSLFILLYYR